jgi:hypothetical protein
MVADPHMWSDPLHRIVQSALFHGDYAQGQTVKEASEPFWKPLLWLVRSIAWPADVFVVRLDTLIGLLGLVGVFRLWRTQRVFALWLIIGVIFLLIWPTKWPQYMKTVSAPLCLAAAAGFRALIWEPAMRWWGRRHAQSVAQPGPAE